MKKRMMISPIEKTSIILFLMCFISYSILGMTRNTYSAAIATLTSEGILTKSNAGSLNFGFYLIYGIAQPFGGMLADRVSPFKLLFAGILGSAVANAIMASTENYYILLAAWSFNGFAQFGVYPAIIKIISSFILEEHRAKGRTYIGYAYTIGAISSYALAIIIQAIWSWRALFVSSVVFLLLATAFYIYGLIRYKHVPVPTEYVEEKKTEKRPPSISLWKLVVPSGLIFITITGFSRCMLDMGVKSWTPTMMIENYPIPISIANSISVILLVINLLGIVLAAYLYPRKSKNPATIMKYLFLLCVPLLLLLVPMGKTPLIIVCLVLIIVTTLMTTASQILVFGIPVAFAKYGRAGTVAGFLNLFASAGVMVSSYLYGYIADHFGWVANIWVWIIIGIIASLSCFIAAPMWNKFTKE